jgi:hypothetical protein
MQGMDQEFIDNQQERLKRKVEPRGSPCSGTGTIDEKVNKQLCHFPDAQPPLLDALLALRLHGCEVFRNHCSS